MAEKIEAGQSQLARANAAALDAAKFEFEKELISRRGQIDLFRDEMKYLNESEQQRQARLLAQIQRWANPIRIAIGDLEHRLCNILSEGGYVALSQEQPMPKNWSADYSYFMASTLFYFAQYFCWTRLLQHQLGYELFHSTGDMESFWDSIERVSDEIARFPYELTSESGDEDDFNDRQIFRLQQRAIGELLIDKASGSEQILTYREFLDRWLDPVDSRLRQHVAPLEKFLADLHREDDLRWRRLEGMRNQLLDLKDTCARIMNPPSAH